MADGTFQLGTRDRKHLSARLTGGSSARPLAIRTAAARVLAEDQDLSTQGVAELLGLSRTFVVRLIEDGKTPAHLAGTHRQVRAADALAYESRRRGRVKGVEQITSVDLEVDLPCR